MLLKVCGLRERDNVAAIAALQPQWMGFIFVASSPRYFLEAKDPAIISEISNKIKTVGVFVNESEEMILKTMQLYSLDLAQLHGDEGTDFCKGLTEQGIKIIKVFRVHDVFDFSIVETYAPYAELFLFDTAGKLFGGNGVSFDWQILSKHRFSKPFLLSGGISPADTDALISFRHPDMIGVDVNSKFEITAGVKNIEAIQLFKQQIA
jgi:phosphoribosylanthranilate isomerase